MNKFFLKFVTDIGPLVIFFFFYYNNDKNLEVAIPPLIVATIISVLIVWILEKKIPILGICVGMQIMAEKSEEGINEGFGWIKSKVKKFDNKIDYLPVPHMGWNKILNSKTNPLTEGINQQYFYFLHSYYFQCEDENNSISSTNYSNTFTAVVFKENIYGVQFHPEKSHDQGTKLLINFSEL